MSQGTSEERAELVEKTREAICEAVEAKRRHLKAQYTETVTELAREIYTRRVGLNEKDNIQVATAADCYRAAVNFDLAAFEYAETCKKATERLVDLTLGIGEKQQG